MMELKQKPNLKLADPRYGHFEIFFYVFWNEIWSCKIEKCRRGIRYCCEDTNYKKVLTYRTKIWLDFDIGVEKW